MINCSYCPPKVDLPGYSNGAYKVLFAIACIYKLYLHEAEVIPLLFAFIYSPMNKLTYICTNIISTYVMYVCLDIRILS